MTRIALPAIAVLALLGTPAAAQVTSTAPASPVAPMETAVPAQPAAPPQVATPAPPSAPAPPTPAPVPAKLTTIAKYDGTGGEVLVGAFVNGDQRVGVLGVSSVRRASVALAKDEWASFLDLWQQARAVHATTWQTVGAVKETGLKKPSTLTVMAGPSVQFTIADARGSFTVAVPKNEIARLDASLHKVALFLDGAAAEPDKPAASVRHHVRRRIRPAAESAPAQRCVGFWC